jgi:hypothetical protein
MIGFCATNFLMLDIDSQKRSTAKKFSEEYAKFHNLGSSALLETSKGRYAVVFGAPLYKTEIKWHVKEAKRLGMVDNQFLKMRDSCGWINIRTSKKGKKRFPRLVKFFSNGDMRGVLAYYRFLNNTKNCEVK